MATINKMRRIVTRGLLALSLAGAVWFTTAMVPLPDNAAKEGERLVHNMDCNVCHTPKVMTERGPQPDPARLLSGHPADEKLPAIPEGVLGPGGWGALASQSLTAWVGPWGVSYASNLTPDTKTGIGMWSEETFITSMRQGLHMEQGRPFIPPMPTYDQLTDEELKAMYAYLRSIKPVSNAVPKPQPPQHASAAPPTKPDAAQ